MRAAVRALVALSVMVVCVLTGSAAASAGGPTSVLLASPHNEKTASFYYADTDYHLLSTAVGEPDRGDDRTHEVGPFVTVTWLVHDAYVWRTERVYYTAPGGPWIATRFPDRSDSVVWHRSPHAKELVSLFARLGLLHGEGGERSAAPAPEAVVAETGDAPEAAPAATPVAAEHDGRLWGFYGLAAGVLATLAVSWVLGRRPRRPGDPGGRAAPPDPSGSAT